MITNDHGKSYCASRRYYNSICCFNAFEGIVALHCIWKVPENEAVFEIISEVVIHLMDFRAISGYMTDPLTLVTNGLSICCANISAS